MASVSIVTARINSRVKALVDKWCRGRGLVMARFIEDAILDKLEEESDICEIEKLRREPLRPLRAILKELPGLK